MSFGEMYSVKPFHNLSDTIDPCGVMYKAPRLQGGICFSSQQGSPEILALKQRQDELISLLDHLINETSSHQSSSILNESNEIKIVLDIVLHVNPRRPPMSLKLISQLLKKKYKVLCKAHVHSSVKQDTNSLLNEFNERSTDRSQYDIIITLIFTEAVECPCASINPAIVSSISGESNIARLFGRLLQIYDSGLDSLPFTVQTDIYLNACDIIMSSTASQSDKLSSLKVLEEATQRHSWFGGSGPGIADGVALSALLQSKLSLKSVSGEKWMKLQSSLYC